MKTFILKSEVYFDAENIDDAFLKLAEHFNNLVEVTENETNEPKTLFHNGEIEIYPVKELKND